ncbi:MAG: TAXI family TRAP transporter solute-binding subunit [Deltaproteobacteria bacterium]|jgi:TRAP transporter TAXI family solute receptor|nr:TAXI family TRAP transporter solute-binding subunit [Deltaproteobacteria bacterium]
MTTMRAFRHAALLLAALVLAFAGGSPFVFAAQPAPQPALTERPPHLRLLTGPNGGQWYAAGERLAPLLTRNVVPTSSRIGGGVANIAAVDKRLGDLAFTLTCFLAAARSGEPEYQAMAVDNVVLMANVYPQVLYFLMRKSVADQYGITDVASLLRQRGPLRFASLRPGTASEFVLSMLLKYGYGANFAKLREQGWSLEFNNYAETADNFVEGKLDCFAYTAGTEVPLILEMEKHTGLVVLPVEQRVLDLLEKKFATSTYTILPGTYKSVTAPTATLGDSTCIIVRKDLQDGVVFDICKTLWAGKDSLVEAVKDFRTLSPKTAAPPGLDIHPGAKRFWDSQR